MKRTDWTCAACSWVNSNIVYGGSHKKRQTCEKCHTPRDCEEIENVAILIDREEQPAHQLRRPGITDRTS